MKFSFVFCFFFFNVPMRKKGSTFVGGRDSDGGRGALVCVGGSRGGCVVCVGRAAPCTKTAQGVDSVGWSDSGETLCTRRENCCCFFPHSSSKAAFKACPDMVKSLSARPSPVELLLQQSGLRRLLAYFDMAGLRPAPPQVSPELGKKKKTTTDFGLYLTCASSASLNRALLLSDKMFVAAAAASSNTLAIASQLHLVSDPTTPAVFLVSKTAKSKVRVSCSRCSSLSHFKSGCSTG